MYERRRSLVAISLAVMFGLLLFTTLDGRAEATRAAELAAENAGLRVELIGTQDALRTALEKLDSLADRIGLLEEEIRRLGGEVPPTTVIVEDHRDDEPRDRPPSTSTTRPPRRTTTTTTQPRRPPRSTTTTTQPEDSTCLGPLCLERP